MNEAPLDPLTEQLLDDQRQRWRKGERRQVESYLEQHAELRDSSEAQMQLIYQEILLREEGGEKPELAEYQARFPSLQEELGLQFAAHELVDGVKADTSFAGDGNRLTEPVTRCPDCNEVVSRISRECAACGSLLPAAEVRPPSPVRLPQVPGYEVLGPLGAGGMGVVYRARHKELKRDVALKMILPQGQAGDAARVRFRLEAEAVARLHHPNIVEIYDFGEYEGQLYFAMELVEGKSLTAWLKEHTLRPREIAALVETLARAVQAAHNRMLVHRDLKPDNVLMAADGSVKITDFGLARHMDRPAATADSSPDTGLLAGLSDGAIMGTPEYMAPEQARGLASEIGPRSDVYSLGTILYRLLTGEPPFVEKHAKSVISEREKREALLRLLKRVIHEPPERPTRRVTSCDRDLEAVCLKCLQKQPDQRYGSAVELAEELARYRRGETVDVRPRGRVVRAWRWCKRNPAVAALLAAVGLLLVTGTAVALAFGLRAEDEKDRAELALADLTIKEREEREAKEMEKKARVAVERLLYTSRLALAQSYWNEGRVAAAREKLDEAGAIRIDPAQKARDTWEHRYLYTLMNHRGQRTFLGHTSNVRSVSFSPDGKRIASASADNTVKVWDAATGQELLALKWHTNEVNSVSFSPDGKRIASASADNTVKVWDAATGQELLALKGHSDGVYSVSFSPDGKRIASGSGDQTVKLWDAATGQERLTLKGHTTLVASVCFSPDGQRLASGSWDHTVKLWDAATGQELLTLKGHMNWVLSVCFSPDGQRLASGSNDRTVKLWDATAGQELLTLKGHTREVVSVCFSPDGRRLASGSWDHTVKLWDAATGHEPLTFKGHTSQVLGVCFSPDGQRLASGSFDQTVKLWNAATGQELLILKGHTRAVTSVCVSPDGQRLASASEDQTVKVWDAATGQHLLSLQGHTDSVLSVSFSPDGERIASASRDKTVKVWDAATGQERLTLKGHTDYVTSVSFSSDGKRIASGSDDNTVKVWDATTGRELLILQGHTDYVLSVSFCPDGRRLASGSHDRTVKLWDAATGQDLLTLKGHTDSVTSVSFSSDGQRLGSGSMDAAVKLWDTATGHEMLSLKGHTEAVTSVCFNPDGRRLASGSSDHTVKLWDAATGQELFTLNEHTDEVNSACFSPDGQRLASGGMDKTVRLWDAPTGQEPLILKGHTGDVSSVCFSPDGRRLASGSHDDTVKLWDAATGQELLTLKGHTDMVSSVCFSPDGRRLASGSHDDTVKLWDAATGQELLTLKGHTIGTSVSFSPDGQRIAFKDDSDKQIVWDLTTGKSTAGAGEQFVPPSRRSPDGQFFAAYERTVIRIHRLPTTKEAEQEGYRWWIDPDYRWHEQQAREAEERDEWFAAAFHWKRLQADRAWDAGLHLRRAHALGQLQKPVDAAIDGLTAVWLDPQVRLQPKGKQAIKPIRDEEK